MAIEDLFVDTVTVTKPIPRGPDNPDSSGGAVMTPYTTRFTNVRGRLNGMNGRQEMDFGGFSVPVEYTYYTFQDGILNGDILVTSEGKNLRVVAFRKLYAIGSLPNYFVLGLEEMRFK